MDEFLDIEVEEELDYEETFHETETKQKDNDCDEEEQYGFEGFEDICVPGRDLKLKQSEHSSTVDMEIEDQSSDVVEVSQEADASIEEIVKDPDEEEISSDSHHEEDKDEDASTKKKPKKLSRKEMDEAAERNRKNTVIVKNVPKDARTLVHVYFSQLKNFKRIKVVKDTFHILFTDQEGVRACLEDGGKKFPKGRIVVERLFRDIDDDEKIVRNRSPLADKGPKGSDAKEERRGRGAAEARFQERSNLSPTDVEVVYKSAVAKTVAEQVERDLVFLKLKPHLYFPPDFYTYSQIKDRILKGSKSGYALILEEKLLPRDRLLLWDLSGSKNPEEKSIADAYLVLIAANKKKASDPVIKGRPPLISYPLPAMAHRATGGPGLLPTPVLLGAPGPVMPTLVGIGQSALTGNTGMMSGLIGLAGPVQDQTINPLSAIHAKALAKEKEEKKLSSGIMPTLMGLRSQHKGKGISNPLLAAKEMQSQADTKEDCHSEKPITKTKSVTSGASGIMPTLAGLRQLQPQQKQGREQPVPGKSGIMPTLAGLKNLTSQQNQSAKHASLHDQMPFDNSWQAEDKSRASERSSGSPTCENILRILKQKDLNLYQIEELLKYLGHLQTTLVS